MEEEVGGESKINREARRSDIQQSKEARKSDILLEKKYNCGMCTSPVADDGIQCGDCRLWFHYICSKLPPYQLYTYEKSNRKYTCEGCSNMDKDFDRKFGKMMAMSRTDEQCQDRSKTVDHMEDGALMEDYEIPTRNYMEAGVQAEVEKVNNYTQSEEGLPQMSDKCIQHGVNSDVKATTTERETQTPESFTSIDKCLTNFQDITVQRLESSFVNAVDNFAKVHNNTTELQNQVRKLTQKRDTLKAQKQHIAATPESKKCNNCQTLQSKIESQEREVKKFKQQIFDVNLEKEIEVAKQQGSLTILNQKYESSKAQGGILQQDIEVMEKRLKIKCDIILEIEEKVKKQNTDVLQLQDEVLAWKLHASRKDDSLVQQGSIQAMGQKVQELPATVFHGKINEKEQERSGEERLSTPRANQEEPVIDIEAIPDKKKVLLIGTSNIKYIDTNRLSSKEVEVEKITKYTLKDGQEYIDALKEDEKNPDVVVLHLFENDIGEETPENCTANLNKMCTDIKRKAKDTKVVVSMGLPSRDEGINRKIMKLNVLLQEQLADMEMVSLCDHGNLFYRGQPSNGILNVDGKHISCLGTQKLAANLKSSIRRATGQSHRATGQSHRATGHSNGNGGYRPLNRFNRRETLVHGEADRDMVTIEREITKK